MIFRTQRHLAKLQPKDVGNPIVPGQAFVEHREIGIHEVEHAQVVTEQFLEKQVRLTDHRPFQEIVELRV